MIPQVLKVLAWIHQWTWNIGSLLTGIRSWIQHYLMPLFHSLWKGQNQPRYVAHSLILDIVHEFLGHPPTLHSSEDPKVYKYKLEEEGSTSFYTTLNSKES
jgi:hypothetical protein